MSYENHCFVAAQKIIHDNNLDLEYKFPETKTILGEFPTGIIIEIFGKERSCKTALALGLIAELQKQNNNIVLVTTDTISVNFAENIGVNLKNLLFLTPKTLEESFNGIIEIIKEGVIDYVFVDSIVGLIPKDEYGNFNLKSELLYKYITELVKIIPLTQTTVVFVNNLNKKFINKREETAGGDALRYYSSIRYQIREVKRFKHDYDDHYGSRLHIKIVKNLIEHNLNELFIDVKFKEGIIKECVPRRSL